MQTEKARNKSRRWKEYKRKKTYKGEKGGKKQVLSCYISLIQRAREIVLLVCVVDSHYLPPLLVDRKKALLVSASVVCSPFPANSGGRKRFSSKIKVVLTDLLLATSLKVTLQKPSVSSRWRSLWTSRFHVILLLLKYYTVAFYPSWKTRIPG